jgi:hypothetical protein
MFFGFIFAFLFYKKNKRDEEPFANYWQKSGFYFFFNFFLKIIENSNLMVIIGFIL